jgi:hypothetical protein
MIKYSARFKKYRKTKYAKPLNSEVYVLFLIIFIFELVGGIYMGYIKNIVMNDAFSRTANAFYVLFIKPPRFASIGLVWNPLPSVLQLPIMLLAKLWRPIASSGIAASMVTAFFSAGSAVILLNAFVRLNVSKKIAYFFIILYVINPFIFFYGLNGMSEMIFFFIIIYTVLNITLWMKEGLPDYILKIGFALAFAFFCRYEAIPFGAAVGLGVMLIIFFSRTEKQYVPKTNIKERYFYAEGTAIVLYTPLLYSVILWILFNWIISGNPLYFLNSTYSNASQSEFAFKLDGPIYAFSYAIKKTIPFLPPLIALIIVRITTSKLFKNDFLVLINMVIIMFVFHWLMLIGGKSFGWLRFFSYPLVICMAWIPYELSELKEKYKPFALFIISISLVSSIILTGLALKDPKYSPEEHDVIISNEALIVANYINEELSEEKVLMDAFLTGGVILNTKNVDNLVISSSLDFKEAIENPHKYGINYLLIPNTTGVGALDAINLKYPELFSSGADWCILKEDFENFKLFEIIY